MLSSLFGISNLKDDDAAYGSCSNNIRGTCINGSAWVNLWNSQLHCLWKKRTVTFPLPSVRPSEQTLQKRLGGSLHDPYHSMEGIRWYPASYEIFKWRSERIKVRSGVSTEWITLNSDSTPTRKRKGKKDRAGIDPGLMLLEDTLPHPILIQKHQTSGLHVFDKGKLWWVKVFVSSSRLMSLTATFLGLELVCEERTTYERQHFKLNFIFSSALKYSIKNH